MRFDPIKPLLERRPNKLRLKLKNREVFSKSFSVEQGFMHYKVTSTVPTWHKLILGF